MPKIWLQVSALEVPRARFRGKRALEMADMARLVLEEPKVNNNSHEVREEKETSRS